MVEKQHIESTVLFNPYAYEFDDDAKALLYANIETLSIKLDSD